MLRDAVVPGLTPPQPQQPKQQQQDLGSVLAPNAPTGDQTIAQNYLGWKEVLANPALAAGLAQFAVSISNPTTRGTAGDITASLGEGAAAAGRAATEADKSKIEAEQRDAQKAQQDLENKQRNRELDLQQQRVNKTGKSTATTTNALGLPPEKRAELAWKAAHKAWEDSADFNGNRTQPEPELNDFLAQEVSLETSLKNGMNFTRYKSIRDKVGVSAASQYLKAWASGSAEGKAIDDQITKSGQPTVSDVVPTGESPALDSGVSGVQDATQGEGTLSPAIFDPVKKQVLNQEAFNNAARGRGMSPRQLFEALTKTN